ncbi:MAG: AzlD domain-containing protein [Clostridia bacterium]|nr:AzlD domain-containing protein [Clostridia bacterium]
MSVRAEFIPYLIVMAVVTYLIRMIPLALIRKKIKNKFILSFLYYVPYAVLSAMVFPAMFFASGNIISAAVGVVVAIAVAFRSNSLVLVAGCSCLSVLLAELILRFL